jgi:hypothetical protein
MTEQEFKNALKAAHTVFVWVSAFAPLACGACKVEDGAYVRISKAAAIEALLDFMQFYRVGEINATLREDGDLYIN